MTKLSTWLLKVSAPAGYSVLSFVEVSCHYETVFYKVKFSNLTLAELIDRCDYISLLLIK